MLTHTLLENYDAVVWGGDRNLNSNNGHDDSGGVLIGKECFLGGDAATAGLWGHAMG